MSRQPHARHGSREPHRGRSTLDDRLIVLPARDERGVRASSSARLADPAQFVAMLRHHLVRRRGLAVVRVQLDRFVRIEQWFGAKDAERLLSTIVDRLVQVAGSADRVAEDGEGCFLAALTVASADVDVLADIAWNLMEFVGEPVVLPTSDREVSIGATVGIVAAEQMESPTAPELLHAAEVTLHQARMRGSRRIGVYDPKRSGLQGLQADLDADLHEALSSDQLKVFFQPQLELPSGRLVGVEALVRWRHPRHGLVRPDRFIGEAERSGLIRRIGTRMLDLACRAAAGWPQDTPLEVGVNVSGAELDDPKLASRIAGVLAETGLPPDRLVLEVTETSLAESPSTGDRRVSELRRLGVRLALDDFGTGYAALGRLRTGQFDKLKLDRSLLPHDGVPDVSTTLLRAATEMAHAASLPVVAEGVETPEQLDVVLAAGCDLVQGRLLAPAMTAETLTRLLEDPAEEVPHGWETSGNPEVLAIDVGSVTRAG